MQLTIVHNPSEHRFEYRDGNDLAVCEYRVSGNVWTLHHTLVPDSMRGMGVAALLVEAALRYIGEIRGTVVPQCSYVASYIRKNPEYSGLLNGGLMG
jgi:predicted GNAT family acetyltransferase